MTEKTEFLVRLKTYVHPVEAQQIAIAIRKMLEIKFSPEVIEIDRARA